MGKEGKKKKQIKLKRGLEPELNAVVERAAAGAVDGGDAGPRVGVENSAFARALASGDWHTRERGVRKLHEWLSTRVDAVTGKDLRYLWKGLFYCFWHSDKVPVQMELADRLASFVINLPHRSALLYYENFLDTMAREWSGIDRLRLDKFMTLTRVFLKSAFARMSRQHWHPDTVVPFSEALRKALGKAGSAGYVMTGFTLHIASIFIDELQGICNEDAASPDTVPWDVLAFLIDPFRVLLASSPSKAVVKRVRDSVYVKLTSEALGCLKSVAKGRGGGAGMAYAQADGLAMTEQLFELAALPQIPRMNRDAIYDAINATERLAVYQEDAPLFSGAEGPAPGEGGVAGGGEKGGDAGGAGAAGSGKPGWRGAAKRPAGVKKAKANGKPKKKGVQFELSRNQVFKFQKGSHANVKYSSPKKMPKRGVLKVH